MPSRNHLSDPPPPQRQPPSYPDFYDHHPLAFFIIFLPMDTSGKLEFSSACLWFLRNSSSGICFFHSVLAGLFPLVEFIHVQCCMLFLLWAHRDPCSAPGLVDMGVAPDWVFANRAATNLLLHFLGTPAKEFLWIHRRGVLGLWFPHVLPGEVQFSACTHVPPTSPHIVLFRCFSDWGLWSKELEHTSPKAPKVRMVFL